MHVKPWVLRSYFGLLPFLNYCIAQLIHDADFDESAFFLPVIYQRLPFKSPPNDRREKYHQTYLFAMPDSTAILFQCPFLIPALNPCLTHHPMGNRLNCRIVSVDLRGYAPADFASMTTRIDCDRFFYQLNVLHFPPNSRTLMSWVI